MNTISRFTIDPTKTNRIITSDKQAFLDDLELLDTIGYEYPHYYTGNRITGYRAAVIEVDDSNIEYIKNIYDITPNRIYWYEIKKHLVFYFKKSLNTFDYTRVTKALAFLYDWKILDYHFYPDFWVTVDLKEDAINDNLLELCTKIFYFKEKNKDYQKIFTINEYDCILETEKISLVKIIEALYWKDAITIENLKWWIDTKHNIHRDYWYGFELVDNYFASLEKTKLFFKENFQINFDDTNSFDYTKSKTWVVITEWDNLFLNNFWYFTLDNTGGMKKLTDFYIKVHSKIIWNEGKHSFVVTLINESEWIETKKIIWENRTSTWLFSDFIQSYWPYHYYGSAPFIKEIHKRISITKRVPEVRQIIWFGHHQEHWIIIFKNWIWDIKQRVFTSKKDLDDDFYYNYNQDGYWVTDKHWNDLSTILSEWIPVLDTTKTVEMEAILDVMWELYADNSWAYLIFLAMGMMWYLAYWDKDKTFPLIFTRGVTWSGKSVFNKLLQRVWGIEKTWTDFENSTVFTMTVTLSYLIKFPYFIAEYRENASMRLQKVWTLRSVFDKISQTKGRADQSVVKYDYAATPILDWEEMITDWALRTRSIQYQLLQKHKIKWNFEKTLRDNWDILDNLLFTYLTRSSWEKYTEYLDEGYDVFKPYTSEGRIAQNIANIYAWCMCFSTKHKDLYIQVLLEVIDFQEKDVQENSTRMQIIKVMSKFIESSYKWIYVRKNDIVISWNTLEDYVNKNRIETSLKINSYKEHLLTMGYEIDFVEVDEALIEWVVIPFEWIKKQLLVNHEVYKWYKAYNLNKE